MPQENTTWKKTQKYLRENCYHIIKCTTAIFLAAFMWRRPLNSVTLATTTHRRSEGESDGTSTQVATQMINKYKIKMIQKGIYKVRDPPWERGREKREKENTVALKLAPVTFLIDLYKSCLLGCGIYLAQYLRCMLDRPLLSY